jgi:hypothetical protein
MLRVSRNQAKGSTLRQPLERRITQGSPYRAIPILRNWLLNPTMLVIAFNGGVAEMFVAIFEY